MNMSNTTRQTVHQAQPAARHKTPAQPEPLVYTKAQLPAVIGLCKSAIDNMRRIGEFPQPVVLGGKKVGWPVAVIKEWVANRPKATSIND